MATANSTVIYKDVPNFPGYRVGDDGTAWSCWCNGGNDRASRMIPDKWRKLKGHMRNRRGQPRGYIVVGLMRDRRVYNMLVHVLVLNAFVGQCPPGMQTRHINDDKTNNCLSNLAWGTPLENAADRHKNGLYRFGQDAGRAKLSEKDIPKILKLLSDGATRRAIASMFGVTNSTINAIKSGRTWKHIPRS